MKTSSILNYNRLQNSLAFLCPASQSELGTQRKLKLQHRRNLDPWLTLEKLLSDHKSLIYLNKNTLLL